MRSATWLSIALAGLAGWAGCDLAVPDAPAADAPTGADRRANDEPPASSTTAEPPVAPSIPLAVSAAPSGSGSSAVSPAGPLASGSGAPASGAASSASATEETPPPPCPPDMVLLRTTCVDPYEGYLVEVAADGTTKPHSHVERPVAGVKYAAANGAGHFPQGYISRVESQAACNAAGKRLCTRGEWQTACRGKGGARWPYGNTGVRDRCNTGKQHLLSLEFPKVPGGLKYDEHFNSPILNAKPGWLAESGKYDGCVSDKGAYDMVGNLHEWVTGTVDQELVDKLMSESFERREQPWREGNGIFMGGFYSTTSEHGPGCEFTTYAHEPSYHDYSTGFRCCKDAVLPKKDKKKPGAK